MWLDQTVCEALVEEVTTVFHVIGEDHKGPRNLASVRTPEGTCLIVGSEGALRTGTRVLLYTTDGAPWAKPSER
jgi:hypothetical protein